MHDDGVCFGFRGERRCLFTLRATPCYVALIRPGLWPAHLPPRGRLWATWFKTGTVFRLPTPPKPSPRGKVGRSSGSDEGHAVVSSPYSKEETRYGLDPPIQSIRRRRTPSAQRSETPYKLPTSYHVFPACATTGRLLIRAKIEQVGRLSLPVLQIPQSANQSYWIARTLNPRKFAHLMSS